MNSDRQKILRRTPHLRRGKNRRARYRNYQDERSRKQEVVRNHDWELVSPSEIHRNMVVKIQFCSESFQKVFVSDIGAHRVTL